MIKKALFLFLFFSFVYSMYAQNKKGNSVLWRIDGPGLVTPSYLFGTVHIPQQKFVEFSDSVYYAIMQTNTFYGEIDYMRMEEIIYTDRKLADFFTSKAAYLDSVSKTESWKALIQRINKTYNESLDPEDEEAWIDFSLKRTSDILQPEPGMEAPDVMLATFASRAGKETGGLETMLLQFDMIYKILDMKLADSTIGLDDETVLTNKIKNYYLEENLDSIDYLLTTTDPVITELMFDKRNTGMADSIKKFAEAGPSFFAIGCGHLPGKKGVIELLRKKGFTLTPVFSTKKISMLFVNDIMDQVRWSNKSPADEDILEPPPPPQEMIEIKPAPKNQQPK